MKRQSTRMRSRSFKRTSERKLTPRDLKVIDFLWNWKAASTSMLKEVAFSEKSYWWAYKALRRLQKEKYLQLLPRGKNLELEVWALTKHGFEVVLMDRDDMEQYRYRVHAPAHDYFATCLQLGDLWRSSIDVDFFTEQQLSSLSAWNFPRAVRSVDGHIPDGVTHIRCALSSVYIGYEVDLNLKDEDRYRKTIEYYRKGLKPNLIVWLVRNRWIAEKIASQFSIWGRATEDFNFSKRCAFVLLEDFKANAWEAKAISNSFAGVSIRKLHTNLLQNAGKKDAKLSQKPMRDIFFPKFKSPQKSGGSKKLLTPAALLTPYGSSTNISNASNPNQSSIEPSTSQSSKGLTNG